MIKTTLLALTAAASLTIAAHANLGDTYEECCVMWFSKPMDTMDIDYEGGGKAYVWNHSTHGTGQVLLILATFNDPGGRCDMIEYWYYEPKTLSDEAVKTILEFNKNEGIMPYTPPSGIKSWIGVKYHLGTDGKTKVPVPVFSAQLFTHSDKSILRVVSQGHVNRLYEAAHPQQQEPANASETPKDESYRMRPPTERSYGLGGKWNSNRTDLDFLITVTQEGLQLGDVYAVHPLRWHPAFTPIGYDERLEWVFRALAVDDRQARYVNTMVYLEETRVKLGGWPSDFASTLQVQLQLPVEIYQRGGDGY